MRTQRRAEAGSSGGARQGRRFRQASTGSRQVRGGAQRRRAGLARRPARRHGQPCARSVRGGAAGTPYRPARRAAHERDLPGWRGAGDRRRPGGGRPTGPPHPAAAAGIARRSGRTASRRAATTAGQGRATSPAGSDATSATAATGATEARSAAPGPRHPTATAGPAGAGGATTAAAGSSGRLATDDRLVGPHRGAAGGVRPRRARGCRPAHGRSAGGARPADLPTRTGAAPAPDRASNRRTA
jgi:hypothetical protein